MPTDASDSRARGPAELDGGNGHRPGMWRGGSVRPTSDGHAVDAQSRASAEIARLEKNLAVADENVGNLRTALESNRRIGIAIGILMAMLKVTDEQAFDLLRRASSERNVKLRLVAEDVIRTGTIG